MIKIRYHALLLTLILSPAVFATTIYKWVDENGVTHYSQQVPPDRPSETLYSEDIEQQKVGFIAPKETEVSVPTKNPQQTAAEAIVRQDKAQAKAICSNAKHQLNLLNTHTRLTRRNAQTGDMERMTEEQRQAAMSAQQEKISLFCIK
ncbi:DUF4124 domain-containing protein [Shewanella algidipiscicola]|uniref:DUF4124 domain-containing protein n=1 Tax=Shewanella algidipiscicola TaxID=614070 RepID=UPI001EF5901E|nr:DUF4124 domain-containing protein [Shewanella algidipiscicola]